MKALPTIIIMCAMPLMLSEQTSTSLRCKSNTRWGQCTNDAVTSYTLCTLHRQLPVASQSATSRTVTTQIKAETQKSTSQPVRSPSAQTKQTSKQSVTPVYSGRCQAVTKKGTQCSCSASSGSHYCWQHSR